jgi:NitT/TauT family transport system substrate-binding protein
LVELWAEEVYRMEWVLVARRGWSETHQEELRRLLCALDESTRELQVRPREALRLLAAYQKADVEPEAFVANNFALSLDQSLLLLLEQESRWALRGSGRTAVPDFLRHLDPRPLRKVDAQAVTVIHAR